MTLSCRAARLCCMHHCQQCRLCPSQSPWHSQKLIKLEFKSKPHYSGLRKQNYAAFWYFTFCPKVVLSSHWRGNALLRLGLVAHMQQSRVIFQTTQSEPLQGSELAESITMRLTERHSTSLDLSLHTSTRFSDKLRPAAPFLPCEPVLAPLCCPVLTSCGQCRH